MFALYSANPQNRPPMTAWLRSLSPVLIAGVLLALAGGMAWKELVGGWSQDEYSHGPLIVVLACLIGWNRLAEVKPRSEASWGGVACFAAGLLLMVAGDLSTFGVLSLYGLITAVAGMIWAFLGPQVLVTLSPAIIYLLFAIPLPRLIFVALSGDLQLLASTIGVRALDALDFPVFQDGNIIDLGGMKLQVVEACSGLRYLFPLMSFGYLIAFLMEDRWWKRGWILLSTVPITIGMNSLRIALIGVTVNLWGNAMAGGILHDFEGWSIFLVCVALLMGEVWVLNKVGRPGHLRLHYIGLAKGTLLSSMPRFGAPAIVAIVMAAMAAATLGTGLLSSREEVIPDHTGFASFPPQFGNWRGRMQEIDQPILDALSLTDYWMADYRDATSAKPPVNLYIAYYASQRVGSSAHSPANCIPGGGWQVAENEVTTVTLAGQPVELSRLVIRKGDAAELVYYWFDERGRDLTEQYAVKWHLLWDSLFLHRTDGALIRFVAPLEPGETVEMADRRIQSLASAALPAVRAYLPAPPAR